MLATPVPGATWPDGALKAPFPYFGGKHAVAAAVWARLGTDIPNFVEPFAGSLAVLLARPDLPPGAVETVNDKDGFVANFWRALRADPDAVAGHADWPVSELDLRARHRWLVETGAKRLLPLEHDPDYFDTKVAGWWVRGIGLWIGAGWGQTLHRKLPRLADPGSGIHRRPPAGLANGLSAPASACADQRSWLLAYFRALGDRLRHVRVCAGDWARVLDSPSTTTRHGTTAVFLDPPYPLGERHGGVYRVDDDVAPAVRAWALAHGDDPSFRIALCGYDDGETLPAGWEAHRWTAPGGYGVQGEGRGRENRAREVVWFSPHCLRPGAAAMQYRLILDEPCPDAEP